jgi:hypothetical protein
MFPVFHHFHCNPARLKRLHIGLLLFNVVRLDSFVNQSGLRDSASGANNKTTVSVLVWKSLSAQNNRVATELVVLHRVACLHQ